KFLLTEDDLREVAKACGISKESLRRILKDEAAEGLFWSVEVTPRWRRKDELFIRLASNIRVEERLTDVAVAEGVFNPYGSAARRCSGSMSWTGYRSSRPFASPSG